MGMAPGSALDGTMTMRETFVFKVDTRTFRNERTITKGT